MNHDEKQNKQKERPVDLEFYGGDCALRFSRWWVCVEEEEGETNKHFN